MGRQKSLGVILGELPLIDERYKTEENLIRGCQKSRK
jgi:hypothetical protein